MRIVVVNVNTTESMTEEICAVARAAAAPDTEIIGLTPQFGPASVEGHYDGLLSAAAVVERVAAYDEPFDAAIVAGFGDLGREGLQELLTVPVVDITEAAVLVAGLVGHSYSVVTMADRSVPIVESRLRALGLAERCASVRATGMPVLELDGDGLEKVRAELINQADLAVATDRAEVVVLGCAGMAGLRAEAEAALGVPVVDGVEAAVHLAESLVRMSLSTSKIRTYARPDLDGIRRPVAPN